MNPLFGKTLEGAATFLAVPGKVLAPYGFVIAALLAFMLAWLFLFAICVVAVVGAAVLILLVTGYGVADYVGGKLEEMGWMFSTKTIRHSKRA